MIPTVLTIAGSDSSGGAGIQADLKAIAANGGYGASVITALTAQNTTGVTRAQIVSAEMIRAQLDAVFGDLDVRAVKTGMLADERTIGVVAQVLQARRPAHYVCDPVMISKSGFALLAPQAMSALRSSLFPFATLVTPNAHEAARLTGIPVHTVPAAIRAGESLVETGAKAVLVKGGHLDDAPGTDVLVTRETRRIYPGEWIDTRHTHGTGCHYSAAIATWLARGRGLEEAIALSKRFIVEAIRAGFAVGAGISPPNPFYEHAPRAHHARNHVTGRLMVLTDETQEGRFSHVELARRAAEGGADWIQFREKRPRTTRDLVNVARAMAGAVLATGARIVMNDRADVASEAGINALHLGRDDVSVETARRLLGGRAVIGGTANDTETAVRLAALPLDYLGVGPVFETRSKANPAPVLGLEGLRTITAAVSLPVFAIGGIMADRVPDVLAAGAYGVAVLSAIGASADPARATREFRERIPA